MHRRDFLVAAGLGLAGRSAWADPMREFSSRFYRIVTDLDEEQARRVGRHMDLVHEAYRSRFKGFRLRGAEGPDPIFLFARTDDYRAFLRGRGIEPSTSAGMFFYRDGTAGLAAYFQEQTEPRLLATLRHEGFHQFAFRRLGPDLPPWANEGLAEYFSDATLEGKTLRAGTVDKERLDRIRSRVAQAQNIPLKQLLAMDSQGWLQGLGGPGGSVQYDQSWSVVHFLVHGQMKYRRAFEAYLKGLAQGEAPGPAFERVFGSGNIGAFETAWAEYLKSLEAGPPPGPA